MTDTAQATSEQVKAEEAKTSNMETQSALPLEETERQAFLARYESAIAKAYPAEPDGTVLLPFPRLFLVATR